MMNCKKNIVEKQLRIRILLSNPWLFLMVFYSSFIIHHSSFSQIGIWQSHVSYQSGQSVAVVGNKIYAATQNGFFYYDKITSETVTLSKTSGLSDVGISRLLYLPDQKRLLLAYRNGNLDFLSLTNAGEPGAVVNVNTIVSASSLPIARGINHLNRIGNNAYMSTDFGLVVLDLVKNEIRDTYFSQRPDGTPLPIFQTAATTDSLYALTAPLRPTETGRRLRAVRFAPNVNIVDPANWRLVTEPGQILESIAVDQGRLVATVNRQGVFERQAGRWTLTQPLTNGLIRAFTTSAGLLIITERSITLPGSTPINSPLTANTREAVLDGNQVWIADTQTGILANNGLVRIAPEGPSRDDYVRLYAYPQTLIALPNGSQDATFVRPNGPAADLFLLPAGRWQPLIGPTIGFNAAAYLPTDQRLFLSSYSNGLSSYDAQLAFQYTPLPTTISPFITDLSTDLTGNLWITTSSATTQQATLHVRRANGQFQSFPAITQTNIAQVVPDDNGFLWLRLGNGGGLLVFDPQTNRSRFLSTTSGQGGLLTNSIRALVKDRNGAIWVGTDLGPMVFDNPAGAFDAAIDAQSPILNRRRLLANELITAIAVDGGNRKWIGTRNGLYHVSPDGSQLLDTFTADNSPLPNNTIQALAVEPVSGKVFIQTERGLISYQGPATEPADVLSHLTIFPNPVRPDFTGTVGINGLTDNATVKILDAGGQLVYETRSQGGTAIWNLRDYRGRSAQMGIYLIVVVAADGAEGLAGKLAVIR